MMLAVPMWVQGVVLVWSAFGVGYMIYRDDMNR